MATRRNSIKRIMQGSGLAVIALLVLSGIAAGSASASAQQWYSCKNDTGSGVYSDSACQTPVGKGQNYEWSKLGTGSTEFSLEGTSSLVLQGTVAGVSTTFTCSGATGYGTLSNPAGSEFGTLSAGSGNIALTGCKQTKGLATCVVENEVIAFNETSGTATEFGGKSALKIGESGKQLALFKEECTSPKTKIEVRLKGTIYTTMNAASSSFEFTEAGSEGLTMNNSKATFAGSASIRTGAAEPLRLGVAAPVNTVAPTVSPSAPRVGTKLTAEPGTWVHEPTSYAYQWRQCSAVGAECKDISGATGSTYTAAEWNEGHVLAVQATATNAGGSSTAVQYTAVVGPEPGSTYHWYVCKHGAGGQEYGDASCSKEEAGGGYKWVKLEAGVPLTFTSTAMTPIKLYYTMAGTNFAIECSSESGSGTVVNPVGGGAGTLAGSNQLLALSGCKYIAPTGTSCTVKGGSITSSSVNGTTSEQKLALSSAEGANLFHFSMSSCMPETMSITGTLNGTVNGLASALEFAAGTSGSELKNAGLTTSIEGSIRLETEFGLLRFKP
jgi:hypothetical protein